MLQRADKVDGDDHAPWGLATTYNEPSPLLEPGEARKTASSQCPWPPWPREERERSDDPAASTVMVRMRTRGVASWPRERGREITWERDTRKNTPWKKTDQTVDVACLHAIGHDLGRLIGA